MPDSDVSQSYIDIFQQDMLKRMVWDAENPKVEPSNHDHFPAGFSTAELPSVIRLLWLPSDTSFLLLAYRLYLGREPEPAGFEGYRRSLALGHTGRAQVLRQILSSEECRARPFIVARHPAVLVLLGLLSDARKLPVLGKVWHWVWSAATISSHRRSLELSSEQLELTISDLRRQLAIVDERVSDTMEYFQTRSPLDGRNGISHP